MNNKKKKAYIFEIFATLCSVVLLGIATLSYDDIIFKVTLGFSISALIFISVCFIVESKKNK